VANSQNTMPMIDERLLRHHPPDWDWAMENSHIISLLQEK
jgi:hypothetical protein